ncbi:MAG: acetyl-CoA carboxylase biotin carboxylase subunit [Chloroflexi bacterium]|nr:acetyl-CoA carboxylase biotin carboxylase subunit [Chloroflexota bacterium]
MKVLVANRGEIALRVMRTCRELGFPTVAVYSEADSDSLPVRYADESVCIGPTPAAESYLNIEAVIDAARKSGADAVHPGYGFLSENEHFARAVEAAGLIFIGPRPETIALTGDKLAARRVAREAGLPVLPGKDVPVDDNGADSIEGQVTFPVLIKAVAGGGGRGIRLARNKDEMEQMLSAARQEAAAAFGDGTCYLEPLVQNARHIEVQILGDGHGEILYLGERECSIQRRRQKLIEEAPAPGLSLAQRHHLFDAALKMAEALNYRSLGTVEFLLDPQGRFYFIEVNPRIQVEHPVTEMVTGIDLVREQLLLAAEGKLNRTQDQVRINGWAIEARVLAEDPSQDFMPVTGEIAYLREPGGPGVRVDSALYPGMQITPNYDSLIAKVIAWGEDRTSAIRRLQRALVEFQIGGIPTDIEFLSQVIDSESFMVGRADTTYLEGFMPSMPDGEDPLNQEVAVVAALLAYHRDQSKAAISSKQQSGGSLWRQVSWREQMRGGA